MLWAKEDTAKTVTVGPVLDADGVAVTVGVVADFKISKNGGAPAALNGSATLTHRHTGYYSLALTATDLDTLGTAEVTIDDTVNACPVKELMVLPANVYDALTLGTDYLDVNAAQVGGVAATAGADRTILLETTIASVTSQTVLVLTAGSADDDAYNGCPVLIEDAVTATQRATGLVASDYVGSTKTLTLEAAPGFTVAATDILVVYPKNVAGGVRGTHVGNTTGNMTGNLVGTVSTVTAIANDGITPNSILPGAFTADKFPAGFLSDTSFSTGSHFRRAVDGMAIGTVGSGSTTTSVVTSALTPAAAVADQFKGKILTFAKDTTTANLRGQSTDITASTSGGILTVTALTDAAVSGDTFSIS